MSIIKGYEKEKFINAMQKAFIEDPLYRFISDDVEVRKKVISIVFDIVTNNDSGKQYINSSIPNAGAVWLNLDEKGSKSFIRSLQTQIRMLFSGGIGKISEIGKSFKKLEIRQKELYLSSSSYLSLLFVSPEIQGRGIASSLLKPEIERFDREKLVCSLDTFNEDNIPIYEKFGFSIVSDITFNDYLVNYQMQRTPRTNA